ncbi:MAG: ribokinase [Oscillochloris sp.]|nr:ribokinase [Oscillochloris sp.]
MIQYLAIGHLTRDVLPQGGYAPGGSVLYATATAQQLGLQSGLLTVAAPEDVPQLPIDLLVQAAPQSTTFENRYSSAGRRQVLHAVAPPIDIRRLPRDWYDVPLVHLAPVVHECSLALVNDFPNALILVTPQGWMRDWDRTLPAEVRRRSWHPDPALLRRLTALVLSIEDVDGDEALPAAFAADCPLVIVTRGAAGATAYLNGHPHAVVAYPAIERDPTGAGDVFAAALLIGLHELHDPLAAAAFAAATAACSVEAVGMAGIPDRETVLQRLY